MHRILRAELEIYLIKIAHWWDCILNTGQVEASLNMKQIIGWN